MGSEPRGRAARSFPEFTPPLDVVWHPLLRSASLLRLDSRHARDLTEVADGLSQGIVGVWSPVDVCGLVALDLRQCLAETEIFVEPGFESPYGKEIRAMRATVGRIVPEMGHLGASPGATDIRDPLRAVARIWLQAEVYVALGRLGATVAEAFEEGGRADVPAPDTAWSAAAGVTCDLSFLAVVLREQAARCVGELMPAMESWADSLMHEVRSLEFALPAEPEASPQEITRPEIPVVHEGVDS